MDQSNAMKTENTSEVSAYKSYAKLQKEQPELSLREIKLKIEKKTIYECRHKGCGYLYKTKKEAENCHKQKSWVVRVTKEQYLNYFPNTIFNQEKNFIKNTQKYENKKKILKCL